MIPTSEIPTACPECKGARHEIRNEAMGMWSCSCLDCADGERGHPIGTGRGRNAAIEDWNREVVIWREMQAIPPHPFFAELAAPYERLAKALQRSPELCDFTHGLPVCGSACHLYDFAE